jgi:GDP-L-fucose synthase
MLDLKNKRILVTGGTGMIGREVVSLLLSEGAVVTVVSIDDPVDMPSEINFSKLDLREFNNCISVCKDADIVFHVAGIKGSPKVAKESPAKFMVPMIQFNTNILQAAYESDVEWVLYTSSMGVYAPSSIFVEDSVWGESNPYPSRNDWFAGWAKRVGELQLEAYRTEGWDRFSIVRPANVYGKYDNFNPETCMVVPALINRVMGGENPLSVWGDGSCIRDFIYAKDVARGMLHAVKNGISAPMNLASGTGISIKDLVEAIVRASGEHLEICWDASKPSGDAMRVLSMEHSNSVGFFPETSLDEGVRQVIEWYNQNRDFRRYDSFKE